jgi:type VI secretion system secreted protein Hcp
MAAYMKIDGPGVPGQATDSEHKDWIPLLSISQGISRPLAGHDMSAQSSVSPALLDVTTKFGKHVPELLKAAASGTDFDKIEIHVCTDQGGGKREAYYKMILEKVHVSSVNVSNASEGGTGDIVMVQFHFQKIEWAFTQWNGKEKIGDTTTKWNFAENKE